VSKAKQVEMALAGFSYGGSPVAAGKLYTYSAGTVSNKATYTAQDQSSTAANPVILDSQGRANIYADGLYKMVLKDASDVTLNTWDNLQFGDFDGTTIYGGNAGGTANALTATCSPPVKVLTTGLTVILRATATNTGPATLSDDGISTTAIQTHKGALKGGEIQSGHVCIFVYSATAGAWILTNPCYGFITTYVPTYTCSGALTYTSVTGMFEYRVDGDLCSVRYDVSGTTGGVASNTVYISLPVTAANATQNTWAYVVDGTAAQGVCFFNTTTQIGVSKFDGSNFGLGASRRLAGQLFFRI
jgi:hypothetical protein